jgi:hypothetical protein
MRLPWAFTPKRATGEDKAMKPFTTLAILLFAIIALAHLYRLVHPFEVVIAGTTIPQWVSIVGAIVGGGLALMLWRESKR